MQYRRAPWMTGACKDMPHRQNEPRVAHIQMEQVWSARRANCELLISARPAGHCTWTPQRGPRSTLPSDHSKGGDAEEERSTFQDSCASRRAGGWCSWDAGHRGGLGPGLWGAGPPRAASFTHHSSHPPALPRASPPARVAPPLGNQIRADEGRGASAAYSARGAIPWFARSAGDGPILSLWVVGKGRPAANLSLYIPVRDTTM